MQDSICDLCTCYHTMHCKVMLQTSNKNTGNAMQGRLAGTSAAPGKDALRWSSQNLKGFSTISTTPPTSGTANDGPGNSFPLFVLLHACAGSGLTLQRLVQRCKSASREHSRGTISSFRSKRSIKINLLKARSIPQELMVLHCHAALVTCHR